MENGEIISIVGDQIVIKPFSVLPAIGAKIFAKDGKLGTVCDIIGPVKSPFFVVKVAKDINAKTGDITHSE